MNSETSTATTATTAKTCFSYIRFSTTKQAKGTSEDRQLQIAPRVAAEKGWKLRDDLNLLDLGLSAYKKQNVGTLKALCLAAESGKIPPGSVMIIEALDRLTRAELDTAQELFKKILRAGIEIYVARSSRHYTTASLNNPIDLIISILELNAANEYSAKLGHRVHEAWKRKREDMKTGKRLTKRCPAWIDCNTWKLIPERAAIVKRVFELYDKGYGTPLIVKQFVREGIPTWGTRKNCNWNASYIRLILKNRACIGEFEPALSKHTDTGKYIKQGLGQIYKHYFPASVEEALFYRIQAKMATHKGKIITDRIVNLFSGIAYCECGFRMYCKQIGDGSTWYTCRARLIGKNCGVKSLRYDRIEHAIQMMFHASPDALQWFNAPTNVDVEAISGQILALTSQIENITESLTVAVTKSLVQKQAQLEDQREALQLALRQNQATTFSPEDERKQMSDIRAIIFDMKIDKDARHKIRDWLLSHVERMVCNGTKGEVRITFKNGHNIQFLLSKEGIQLAPYKNPAIEEPQLGCATKQVNYSNAPSP